MTPVEIGAKVRAAREQMGVTLDVLAEAAGVSKSTLKRIERGKGCGLQELLQVAELVGLQLLLEPPGLMRTTLRAVCDYLVLDLPGLRRCKKAALTPEQIRDLARLIQALLRGKTWHGTQDELREMDATLRRMVAPRRRG